MQCQVDGNPVHQVSVNSGQWSTFTFSENLTAGNHQLQVAFTNDAYSPPEDRTLFISKIELRWPSGTQPIADQSELFKVTMASPKHVEWQLQELRQLIDTIVPGKAASIKIAATEFNALYGFDRPQVALIADLKSALLSADMLYMFARNQIAMANFWSVIGYVGFGAIKKETLARRPSYHALSLLTQQGGNTLLNTTTISPTFNSLLFGNYEINDVPYLSAMSSGSSDHNKLFLSVINKHETQSIQTTITLTGFDPSPTAQVWTLTGPSANSSNEIDPNTVKPVLSTMGSASQTFTYSFPPHSLTFFELTAKGSTGPNSPKNLSVIGP